MVVLLPSLIESETCSSIIQETIKAKGQAIPFISTSSKKKETFVASWPRTNNMVEKSYSDAGNRTPSCCVRDSDVSHYTTSDNLRKCLGIIYSSPNV